jgi:hypothetical protein
MYTNDNLKLVAIIAICSQINLWLFSYSLCLLYSAGVKKQNEMKKVFA